MNVPHFLLVVATLLGGLLAGSNFDRALIAMPAWRGVGVAAWAEFSRKADLGNGLLLYPVEAIGAALLTLAATVAFQSEGVLSPFAAGTLYAAIFLALVGLLLTIKAAPAMLGIRNLAEASALERAFISFRFWGNLRGVCQILSFVAQVVALAASGAAS